MFSGYRPSVGEAPGDPGDTRRGGSAPQQREDSPRQVEVFGQDVDPLQRLRPPVPHGEACKT